MNIIVTGATGRIGSRAVPKLLDRNHHVKILVRKPESAQALKDLGAEMITGDLLNPETYKEALSQTDTIIHLAAFFRGATADETQTVNFDATVALAEAALQMGVSRFIFASTNLVYGPGSDLLFKEEDALQAETPYPATKAAAEQALMELYKSRGLDLRILRFAFVYGEKDAHLREGLQWFRNWNPMQRMHLVHHADVAQSIVLATETPGIAGQIYNVADDKPVTAGEIMQIYNEPVTEEASNRPIDPAWLQIVDTTKIRATLGFKPIYPSLKNAVEAGAL